MCWTAYNNYQCGSSDPAITRYVYYRVYFDEAHVITDFELTGDGWLMYRDRRQGTPIEYP